MKFSDSIAKYLINSNFTHCYFVAGGNIMHLINSFRERFTCIPVVHEVAAVISAEYHNANYNSGKIDKDIKKGFALVTAGPGLTNTITGLAGAWLESRELLLLGGQVKVEDLSFKKVRQLGIQEINGVEISKPICKKSLCLQEPINEKEFCELISASWDNRPGPVFIELPLDVQAADDTFCSSREIGNPKNSFETKNPLKNASLSTIRSVAKKIKNSKKPVFLLGGGISANKAWELESILNKQSIPIMTTWNGSDRYGSNHKNYFGRPNTWGMRYSNIILQNSDFVIALGTRLGLQQTGFNWKEFIPKGEVIQVDIDPSELKKDNPKITKGIEADANDFLEQLLNLNLGMHYGWLNCCSEIKELLPLSDKVNKSPEGYLNPFDMVIKLSEISSSDDHIVPCSSGGAFTVMMQAFEVKQYQTMTSNKGLASMGYGLSGAIGSAISDPANRTILVEGDGGFAQNLQEMATVSANNLNIKIFLFCNEGYASIRMTQKNYFKGNYIGCDKQSGLGFPDWQKISSAYNIKTYELTKNWFNDKKFLDLWDEKEPSLFIVNLHPEQTYFPKISSRVKDDGSMESNPLHIMTPELDKNIQQKLDIFLNKSMN